MDKVSDNDIRITIASRKQIDVEYIAKVLINEAHMVGLDAFCGKTYRIMQVFHKNFRIKNK